MMPLYKEELLQVAACDKSKEQYSSVLFGAKLACAVPRKKNRGLRMDNYRRRSIEVRILLV